MVKAAVAVPTFPIKFLLERLLVLFFFLGSFELMGYSFLYS
jgi:hypothetical protein